MNKGRLILLDRDGVINEDSADFIKSPAEFHAYPDSLRAIAELTRAGFAVAVATNQSGVGRGLLTLETLKAIHELMLRQVVEAGGEIVAIEYCPHHPDAGCECRKPLPGMLLTLAERLGVADLSRVPYVGDSTRDQEAARQAGALPMLVLTGKGRETLAAGPPSDVRIFPDLAAVAAALIREG